MVDSSYEWRNQLFGTQFCPVGSVPRQEGKHALNPKLALPLARLPPLRCALLRAATAWEGEG